MNSGCLFANLIIQFFVKMNNPNTLKVLNLHSRFGALFLWGNRGFVGESSSLLLDNRKCEKVDNGVCE